MIISHRYNLRYIPVVRALCFCILFLSAYPLCAQQDSTAGLSFSPVLTARYGSLLLINRDPGVINQFGAEGDGRSYEIGTNMGFATVFPDLFGDLIGSLRIGGELAGGKFVSDEYSGFALDAAQQLVPAFYRFAVDAFAVNAHIEGRIAYPVSSDFTAFAGPWATYRLYSSALLREEILRPDNVVFASGATSRIVTSGNNLLSPRAQYGIRTGVSMPLLFMEDTGIEQDISLDINISSLFTESTVQPVRPAIGLTFNNHFGTPNSPKLPGLPLPPSVSFDIFAIDSTGARRDTADLHIHSTLVRRYIALPLLLPPVPSTKLEQSLALLRAGEADSFSMSTLQNITEQEVFRHVLNILGMRMRSDSAAVLTLAPVESPTGHTTDKRAEAVRRYLVDVWSIDSSHVLIAPINSRIYPVGSLLLRTSSTALLAPVLLQSQEENIEAPHIGMDKEINPESSVSWAVELQRNGRILNALDDSMAATRQTMSFALSGMFSDTTQSPLTARLTVADGGNVNISVFDTLHISVDRNSYRGETHIYTLLPPIPGLTAMTTVNDVLLAHLQNFVDANTAIMIEVSDAASVPYASETGEHLLAALNAQSIHPASFTISSTSTAAAGCSFIRLIARKTGTAQ